MQQRNFELEQSQLDAACKRARFDSDNRKILNGQHDEWQPHLAVRSAEDVLDRAFVELQQSDRSHRCGSRDTAQ